MPIWTTGPRPGRRRGARGPGARRSPSPRCGCTVQPGEPLRRSSPRRTASVEVAVEREVALGRRPRRRRRACRAAPRRRARRPPPCRPRAPSRVFTRPGDRRLRDHQGPHAAASAEDSTRRSRGRCGRCRAPSRDLRAGAGGARVVGHVELRGSASRPRSPCAAARRGSRSVGPARRGRAGPAAAHAHRGDVAHREPDRRRISRTTRALPNRACHGQTRARPGRRRPTAMSPRPACDGAQQRGQVVRVERPVPVHDRDVLRRRPPRRLRARRRRTRAAARCTTRAPSRARPRRCRRASRCRRRSRANPAGTSAQQALQGARLVLARAARGRRQPRSPCLHARNPQTPPGRQGLRNSDVAPTRRRSTSGSAPYRDRVSAARLRRRRGRGPRGRAAADRRGHGGPAARSTGGPRQPAPCRPFAPLRAVGCRAGRAGHSGRRW